MTLARLAFVASLLVPTVATAQARQHVIQGHVTSDSGAVVAAADVIVTIAPSAEVVTGKTDANGDYRIVIANPTGEYILNISVVGFRPFRQRVTIAAADSIATVNAKLAVSIQQVAAVRVQAQRPRPTRSIESGPGIGTDGANKQIDGVLNAVSPDMRGNIDALAALVPGLAVTGNGVSAFGLGSDANMTTLNGMPFSAGSVPRDLSTTTNFITSTWDPRYGGFSGALQSSTLARGTNIETRRASSSLDTPMLQASDPIAARAGQKFTNLIASGASSGPFSLDKYFYNMGYQAWRRTADVATLLDLDRDALLHAGIAPDSAFRLTQILGAQRIPLTTGGVSDQRTTIGGSFLGRFDHALPTAGAGAIPPAAWNVMVGANASQSKSPSISPTSLAAASGTNTDVTLMLQGLFSTFLGKYGDYINETTSNVTFAETRGTPYLRLPSGSVLIASTNDASGVPTIGSLAFGGNSALSRDSKTVTWELDNQTNFLVNGHQSLPAKLFLQSRYEHFDQSLAANRLGNFSYASLTDLAENTPSSFSRTLNVPDRSGGQWLGAASLGGVYNSTKLVLTGGARVDGNVFTALPAYNPAIERRFGLRNDRAPNSIDVSPRLGFNWYYNARPGISMFANSAVGSTIRGGVNLRGGIGKFRSFLPSTLLSDAIGTTGLPGSTARLVCTGPAAPIPDWTAFAENPASIPTTCVGGQTVFADTAPAASMIDSRYRPSTAWRGGLGWTNTIRGNYIAVDGLYSLNLNQPGTIDLNFAGNPRFTLGAEGNRPVYVAPSSIVASTGSVTAVESRVSSEFGRVTDRVSDLRGDTRQLTVYTIPSIPFRFGIYTIGYTYADARIQARGFDQSTASDPRTIEWASSPFTPRHQFVVQGGRSFFGNRVSLTTFVRAMSGLRYTPTVGGDVNGDGSFNDRAFVFDPARVADTSVARGLRDLMATGSSSARKCLLAQLGSLAGRNSCVGPWTATMNASLNAPRLPGTNNRVDLSINFANPLGGLDLLLHGNNNLRGWGAAPLIDGSLYQVRGFDPTTKQFTYSVNPRFGNTNPSTSTFRTPFRVTFDVRIDLGHNSQEQSVILAMRIKPPMAGTRASYDTLKARYLNGTAGPNGYSDIYKIMLRLADSLALSRQQSEQMQGRQKFLAARADSVYGVLARYLVELPANFSSKDAAKHVATTNDDMWKIIYSEAPWLKELLTPGQIRLLPAPLRDMVLIKDYRGRFYFGP
ncbi:MAG TPA: carboxypeptidase-like regulatory domain-containing protein [Gemmatimonadaceae bacterium]